MTERPTLYPLHRQRITPDDYTENKLRYDQEISRVKQQIERLGEADKSFYVTASYLLQLFKHGEKIFEVASIEEKRELMKLVLSNLELKGKTARFTPNEPFATVLKLSERSTWQGLEDGNITFSDELDFNLAELDAVYKALDKDIQ